MKEECPEAYYLEWEGYAISYPTASMVINMAWQSLRITKVILNEHRQMKKWVAEIQPDLIVSDGRFGCHHTEVKSIWMAHQLQIQHSFRPFALALNFFYHRFVRRNFNEIWIPDFAENQALAGRLSRPILGISYKHLSALSRYSSREPFEKKNADIKYRWLVLLSGPEPQRSYLEKELIPLLEQTNEPCLLIRGVVGESIFSLLSDNIQVVNCLYGDELHTHVMATEQLICRSGYSTLLDLYYWQKTAILVPTPGQTEQIYLAKYWKEKGWAEWQKQGRIELIN